RAVFTWSTAEPRLNTRFRFEWRFRARAAERSTEAEDAVAAIDVKASGATELRPSELMRRAGIVQRGAPMLDRAARWFVLPAQATLATDVVERIRDVLQRICRQYEFSKGVGLAAPQIGIDWAAAVVLPQPYDADAEPIVLLNPKLVGEAVEQDEQYEGCLSFFDVRGKVSRPLIVEVEHESLDGVRKV